MRSLLQNSQRETTIGTILQVKLNDKDYEKTKSTLDIKWRVLVLIRVPICTFMWLGRTLKQSLLMLRTHKSACVAMSNVVTLFFPSSKGPPEV